MTAIIEQNKEKLTELCRKYQVSVLEVFGSAATGDFDEDTSDIDLLVEFRDGLKGNRFDVFFAFHEELQKLFCKQVDLVEPGGLKNPYFIKRVNETRRRFYADS